MRKKGFKRKISNMLLLGVLLAIVLGIYYNIYNSRAEEVVELEAIALDSYGYLENEEFKLEAKVTEDDTYEIELPESINTKKVNQVFEVTLESILEEALEQSGEQEDSEETNTSEETTTEGDLSESEKTQEAENTSSETQITEVEIIENKITLTKEQVENNVINVKVEYDIALLEKNEEGEYEKELLKDKTEDQRNEIETTEETQVLYSQILKYEYENEENEKLVEVRGYLPLGAELQIEEVSEEQLTEIFGDAKIDVAYDIKIVKQVVTIVPVDEEEPDGETKEVIETVEINPEEFGETCEVSIKDKNISADSQIYHVKEDNTYEQVNVKESTDENITFEAQTFSIYVASSDEGIETAADITVKRANVVFSPSENTTWDKEQSTIVTVTSSSSRYEITEISYAWSTDKRNQPTDTTIFTSGTEITIGDVTGKYYLWVKSKTKLKLNFNGDGLPEYTVSGAFYLDNTSPTVQVSSSATENGKKVTIQATDADSGIATENTYQYYLSTSATSLEGGTWTEYTLDTEFPIENQTGTKYLFVKTISDEVGNISDTSIDGTMITVDSTKYHVFGPYVFDDPVPTVTITADQSNPTNSDSITYTFTFSEDVTGFTADDITVINGTKGTFSGSGTTYTLVVTNSGSCTQEVKVPVGVCTDGNGNENAESEVLSIVIDRTSPTITVSPASATKSKSTTVTITAADTGETGLNAANTYEYYLSTSETGLANGTWTTYSNGSPFTIGSGLTGTYYLFVRTVSDEVGNISSANGTMTTVDSTKYHVFGPYVFDSSVPTVRVSTDETSPTNASSITYTITFSEEVTDFTADDITVTSGTKGTFSGSGATYTLVVTNSGSGTQSVSVAAGVCTDTVGNSNTESNTVTIVIDRTAPTVTANPTSATVCQSASVTITLADLGGAGLSETTGQYYLSSSDTALADGKWTAYSSGAAFTIGTDLTGTYYLFVKTVTDQVGNVSSTNGTMTTIDGTTYHRFGAYVFDSSVPTVTVTADKSTLTNASSITYTFTFSEEVTGFTADGITVTNGTKGTFAGSGTTYTLEVTNSGSCVQTVSVAAGAGTDAAGNSNTASNVMSITIDRTAPTITVSPASEAASKNTNVTITVEELGGAGLNSSNSYQYYLSSSPTDLEDGIWTTYTSGTAFTIGTGLNGTYYLFVKTVADQVGNVSSTNGTITTIDETDYHKFGAYVFDNTTPTLTISASESSPTNASSITYTFTFSKSVTGFTVDDIEVTNGTKGEFSGSARTYTLVVTNEGSCTQTVEVSEGVCQDEAGNTNLSATESIVIDRTGPELSVANTLDGKEYNGEWTNGTVQSVITFSDSVSGVDATTLEWSTDGSSWTTLSNTSTTTYTQTWSTQMNETVYYRIADTLGNYSSISFTLNIDKTAPTITANPSTSTTVAKTQNVTLTVAETGSSGLATSNQYQYCLILDEDLDATFDETDLSNAQTSDTTKWKTYASGTAFAIGENELTGTYYLIVKTVSDNAGNASANSTTTIGGTTYHKFGPYIFDNDGPKVTVTPASAEAILVATGIDVTIEWEDVGGAGLASNSQYQYAVSDTYEGAYSDYEWKTYTSGTAITIGKGEEGTKYLIINPVEDALGNRPSKGNWLYYEIDNESAETMAFGPYVMEIPVEITFTPDGNSTWAKSQTTKITVTGTNLDASSLKYQWTQSSTAPTTDSFTNTFTNGTTLAKADVTGEWYLWVLAKDTAGATTVVRSEAFYIDNTAPEIAINPQEDIEWAKTHEITVTISDENSGLAEGAQVQYGWSTSNTDEPNNYTTTTVTGYNGGETSATVDITATGLTGQLYLWVKPVSVKDTLGNTQADTVISKGTFYFDNTEPTITINPQENTEWAKTHEATVTITDENSGLATGAQLQYGWSESNTKEPENYTTTTVTDYSTGDAQATFKATGEGLTGKLYLWIKPVEVKDTLENAQVAPVVSEGTFYFDNQAPTVGTLSMTVDSANGTTYTNDTWTNKDVYISVSDGTDDHSGHQSTTYSVNGGEATTEAQVLTTSGTYEIVVTTIDNVGNEASTTYTIKIDKNAPTITVNPSSTTATKEQEITITIAELAGSELSDSNVYEYTVAKTINDAEFETNKATYESGEKFTIGTNLNGEYYLFVRRVADVAGNSSTPTDSIATKDTVEYHKFGPYVFDNLAPTVTINPTENNTYAKLHDVEVTISDENSGLATGAQLQYAWSESNTQEPSSWATTTITEYTAEDKEATTTITGSGLNGVHYLWLKVVTANDIAGNAASEIITSGEFWFDNTAPTLEITADKTSPTNASTITYTFTFSEEVTDFTIDDIEVTNGTKGTFAGSGTTYTLEVTNDGTCVQTVSVAENVCEDTSKNGNEAASITIEVDRTQPTITITADQPSITNVETITYTIEFSELVTGFEQSDVTISNGEINTFTKVSDTKYIVTATSNAESAGASYIQLIIDQNKVYDLAGNANEAHMSDNILVDVLDPYIAINPTENEAWKQSHTVTAYINDNTSENESGLVKENQQIKYAWSQSNTEEPTSWTTVDVSVSNEGSKSASASATIIGSGLNGAYYIWVKPVNVEDLAGNIASVTVTSGEFWFDNTSPTLEITANEPSPTNASTITYTFTFSEEVTDFTIDDIEVTNGTKGTFAGSGTTYTLVVTNDGTCVQTVSVSADVCKDTAENKNEAASITIEIDRTAPTVEITADAEDLTSASSITYTFKFSENVTGFTAEDITITNGTKGDFDGSGDTYTLVVTNSGSCIQNIKINSGVCTDEVGNENVEGSKTINIDQTAPMVEFAPNGNSTPEKSQITAVTVTDPTSDTLPSAGVDTTTLKYVWTDSTDEPADSKFTTSFASGDSITLDGIETGGRYLWIIAADTLGNTIKTHSEIFNFDNMKPTITVDPDSITTPTEKVAETTITVGDVGGAGLAGTNEYKYYLSASNTALEGGEEKTYQSGIKINNLGAGLTGTYYLFVRQVSDTSGNLSENYGELVEANGETWHRFGEYLFDNRVPEVVFGTDGNETWAKEHSTKVTLQDSPAGLNTSTLKYLWTQSTTAPTKAAFEAENNTFANGDTITSPEGVSGNDWRLWIYAEDNLEHTLITSTNTFYLDNTAPSKAATMTMKLDSADGTVDYSNDTWTNHDVYIALNNDAEDAHSGVAGTTYTVNGGTATLEPQTLTATGTYEIVLTTTDNVGLTTTRTYTIKIDKTLPTVGTMTMKLDSSTGTTNYDDNTWTNHSVYVEVNDGSDAESDHKQTTYTVNGGEATSNSQVLDPGDGNTATYTIVVTTEDMSGDSYSEAGNKSTKTYTVKIDKTKPTAGNMDMEVTLDNGTTAEYQNDTWTKQSVTISKVDGSDEEGGSGHKETKYTVTVEITNSDGTKTTETVAENQTAEMTLDPGEGKSGVYTIAVVTEDKSGEDYSEQGNLSDARTYTVKIDKTNPVADTLTMKAGNNEGTAYENELAISSDVYIELKGEASDLLSGVKQTTYNVYYMGENNSTETDPAKGTLIYENQTDSKTLNQTGRYIVVLTTEDMAGDTYSEAGNKSTNTYYIVIDKDLPTVTANPNSTTNASANDYVKTQNVTITVAEMGTGLDTSNGYEYCLILDTELDATFNAEDLSNAQSADETKWKTYSSGTAFEIGENKLSGTYYLIVKTLKDKAGNTSSNSTTTIDGTTYHMFGPYKFDNTEPTITVVPDANPENGENQNVVKQLDVTITYTEPKYGNETQAGGISNSNTYEYYLSTSDTELAGGSITTVYPAPTGDSYTKTGTINIGSGETGVRYLFVRTISDNLGNESTLTITSEGANYQLVGTYIFDNTVPIANFEPDGNSEWAQTHSSKVTVTDQGVANVDASTFKYLWAQGDTQFENVDEFNTAYNEETVADYKGTFSNGGTVTSPSGVTGANWYLWIYAEDNLGNASITSTANPFYLDNTLPRISVSPETADVCKSTDIIIVASDIGAGVSDSNEYKAYLSESNANLVNHVEIGYTPGTTIEDVGAGMTGWRYLFVRTVKDDVGLESEESGTIVTASDGNKYHVYGPYIFDNQAPKVEYNPGGNGEWKTSQTTTVTISENPYTIEAATETAGEAGINKSALKYVWRKASEGTPTKAQITETLVIDGTSETTDSIKGTTIEIKRDITKNTDSDNDWVLWIYAEDTLGNSEIVSSAEFWLDNTKPTVTASPLTITTSNVVENTDVTLTLTDAHSGLNDTNNSYQYYLSTSDSLLTSEAEGSIFGVPQSLTTFTLGDADENGKRTYTIERLGSTETGTRYLFVKSVKDNVGNESITEGTIVEIDGVKYHRFGPYNFDNASPKTTKFEPASNTTAAQSQSVKITIEDQGGAGLNAETFKYLWIQSNAEPTTESFDTAYADETIIHKGTFTNGGTVTIDTETGNDWYLWISAEDNFGHRYIDSAGAYYLDNTKPTITANPSTNPDNGENQDVVKNIDVTLTYADPIYGTNVQLAGISDTNTYEYYLSTSDTELAGGSITTVDPAPTGDSYTKTATITIGAGETGTRYLFVRTIKDNAGNESEYTVTSGSAHYQLVGTYIFDNTAPVVSFNPNGETTEWKLEQTTDVTVQDNEAAGTSGGVSSGDTTANTNSGSGVAGVKTSTIKYRWVQGTDTVLTTDTFANGDERAYTSVEDVVETITETIGSTEPDETSLTLRKTGDNWYLWIYAEDNLGNASVTRTTNPFKIDNTLPTISVSPESADVCKSTSITIIAVDLASGLNSSNEYKAYLSTSSTDLVKETEIGYTSGTTIEDVGSTITGTRYLFVKTVKDNVGLESTQSGTIVTASDGNNYHVYGPYIFDNTAPVVLDEYYVTDGLIRYYDAENNTGSGHSSTTTTWKDLSGNYDAQINGAYVHENYVEFDGVNDWVNAGQITGLEEVTLEATVMIIETSDSNNDSFSVISNSQDGGMNLCLIKRSCFFIIYGSSIQVNGLETGKVYNIIATYDGTTMKLYVNGILRSQCENTAAIQDPSGGTVMAFGTNPYRKPP